MKTNAFGNLEDFTPRTKVEQPVQLPPSELERINTAHGFTLDNYEEKRNLFATRRPRGPKTEAISMRLRVPTWNKFQKWCETNGYTVAEAFDILVSKIPE